MVLWKQLLMLEPQMSLPMLPQVLLRALRLRRHRFGDRAQSDGEDKPSAFERFSHPLPHTSLPIAAALAAWETDDG